jgi:hypothetical protein
LQPQIEAATWRKLFLPAFPLAFGNSMHDPAEANLNVGISGRGRQIMSGAQIDRVMSIARAGGQKIFLAGFDHRFSSTHHLGPARRDRASVGRGASPYHRDRGAPLIATLLSIVANVVTSRSRQWLSSSASMKPTD